MTAEMKRERSSDRCIARQEPSPRSTFVPTRTSESEPERSWFRGPRRLTLRFPDEHDTSGCFLTAPLDKHTRHDLCHPADFENGLIFSPKNGSLSHADRL